MSSARNRSPCSPKTLRISAGSSFSTCSSTPSSGSPLSRRFLLDLGRDRALRHRLVEPKLERYIGVIYRPETELMSHYAESSLPKQFDAFVWFDATTAVTPLAPEHARPGVPDTYPFGL